MKKTTTTKPKIGARSCGACNACCSAFEINEFVQITKKVHALPPPAAEAMTFKTVDAKGRVVNVKPPDLPVIGREPDGQPFALHKPKGVACDLLNDNGRVGCSIHDDRPKTCSSFFCGWLLGLGADDARPDRSGVIVTVRAPGIARLDTSPMNEKHLSDSRVLRLLAGGRILAVVESKVGGLDSPRGRALVEGLRRVAPVATFTFNSDTPTLAGPPAWMKAVAAAIEALPPEYTVRSTAPLDDGCYVEGVDDDVVRWTLDEKKAGRFDHDEAHRIAALTKKAVAVRV